MEQARLVRATLGSWAARQDYRAKLKTALDEAVEKLSEDDRRAFWKLPTTACRPVRRSQEVLGAVIAGVTLGGATSCLKFELHRLCDREGRDIEVHIQSTKVCVNGGLRPNRIQKTTDPHLVNEMYTKDEAGKQAETVLVANKEASIAKMLAKQKELGCHYQKSQFEHLMLPSGRKPLNSATATATTQVLVPDSDDDDDDDNEGSCAMYHECKCCGLQEPCTGKVDCMRCLQAEYFVLNQRKQPEPETAKPTPEPKRRKLIKLVPYKF